MLQEIFDRQLGLQTAAYSKDLTAIANDGGEALAQEIKDNILGLEDELHEALGEVGWKPWATARHINKEAYLSELVDALHFLVNLYALGGGDAVDMFNRYLKKNKRNRERQLEGYDGLKGKCPGCHRALDDPAVECITDKAGWIHCWETGKNFEPAK